MLPKLSQTAPGTPPKRSRNAPRTSPGRPQNAPSTLPVRSQYARNALAMRSQCVAWRRSRPVVHKKTLRPVSCRSTLALWHTLNRFHRRRIARRKPPLRLVEGARAPSPSSPFHGLTKRALLHRPSRFLIARLVQPSTIGLGDATNRAVLFVHGFIRTVYGRS
jgi:hypothetical protein